MQYRFIVVVALAANLVLASCGSGSTEVTAETEALTTDTPTTSERAATTLPPPTTEITCGEGKHRSQVNTCVSDPTTTPAPTTTTIPTFPVDPATVIANAFVQGVSATGCSFPATIAAAQQLVCPVVNGDQSEGTWSFTLNTDMSVTGAVYAETKAAPLTRDSCQETPPEGQFQKDSTQWTGHCLHFYASVFQFDANTGPCSFLGYYGSSPHGYNYEFSNAIIRVDGGDRCGVLGPVVQDSLVEVWAVDQGIKSYDTTIGGTNTYTVFSVVDIAIYG